MADTDGNAIAPGQGVDGTLATYVVFPEVELVKIPDNLTWAEVGSELLYTSYDSWGRTDIS